ncbi:MAG: tRNA 2-selenouridine(34) synthase MnmH [Bacteroidales bacterium]
MVTKIQAKAFLELLGNIPLLDVRSPDEYIQGHIPGAKNLPLFTDDERAQVGIRYKNSGREFAVKLGLQIAGPKLTLYADEALRLAPGRKALVHCWRGGMRSESIAWLLHMVGYEIHVLDGGYKAYRQYIRSQIASPAKLILVGGLTGSGKSAILKHLALDGEQVLDLETLARHKGSVFGGLGQPDQPTTEQFENNIYPIWNSLDLNKVVWVEDESRAIGSVNIPEDLFHAMMQSPVAVVELPVKLRVKRLVNEYAGMPVEGLAASVIKIKDSLGGAATKQALEALETGDFETTAALALVHYDKAYSKSLSRRNGSVAFRFQTDVDDPASAAEALIKYSKNSLE